MAKKKNLKDAIREAGEEMYWKGMKEDKMSSSKKKGGGRSL